MLTDVGRKVHRLSISWRQSEPTGHRVSFRLFVTKYVMNSGKRPGTMFPKILFMEMPAHSWCTSVKVHENWSTWVSSWYIPSVRTPLENGDYSSVQSLVLFSGAVVETQARWRPMGQLVLASLVNRGLVTGSYNNLSWHFYFALCFLVTLMHLLSWYLYCLSFSVGIGGQCASIMIEIVSLRSYYIRHLPLYCLSELKP